MLKLPRIVLIACLAFVPALQVYANNEASALFNRALVATKTLSYRGVFVLKTGDSLQTIRIFHRHSSQGESVRLIAQNGVAKEFIRHNDVFVCISPDGTTPKHSMLGFGFPDNLMRRLNQAKKYYHIQLGGDKARVAGQKTQQLKLISVDNNRYNYHLWIAEDSGVLLQADIVDGAGRGLRKSAFSLIDVGVDITDDAFRPEAKGHHTHAWKSIRHLHTELTDTVHDNWHIWLPEGFALTNQKKAQAKNGAAVNHSVYSDGLSSISVISEKMRRGHRYLPLSMSTSGGITHAVADVISGHFLTVVGEVPATTVEKIAESIRYE